MLGKKEIQILKLLYQNKQVYLTSKQIAELLAVSERTARKYLHLLEDQLNDQKSATLVSKSGQGFQLSITEPNKFEKFYLQTTHTPLAMNYPAGIQETSDRQHYLLNRLFLENDAVYVDDVADELFVSRSTISNDIAEIKKRLAPYYLELSSKANRGLFVKGEEKNIRHFIMNYFFLTRLQDNMYAFSTFANLLGGISIEEIVIVVIDECRESNLILSDFIIYNIVLHIGLAIKRIQEGNKMNFDSPLYISEESKEFKTAEKIIARLMNSSDIEFPVEEAYYIAMHLYNKVASEQVYQKASFDEEEIKRQLLVVLNKFDQQFGYHFEQDSILIEGLMMHFIPLFLRLQNQTSMKNPLLKEIQESFPDLFNATVELFSEMPAFRQYTVTKSEWAYLAIHLTAAVERFHNGQKAHVLVICATGLGSSQMLKTRLEHEMGTKIYIEKVISYYELADQDLDQIDLIISSIHLPKGLENIPVVYVSVFLSNQDIQTINQHLSEYKMDQNLNNQLVNRDEQLFEDQKKVSLVNECITEDLFIKLTGKWTKEDVLEKMLDLIAEKEQQPVQKTLAQQLKLRESYSSVVFSELLAVPHPIEAVTKNAYVPIVIAPEGIFWNGDHQKIQMVALLSPDKWGHVELEKISQMFVPILEDVEYQKRLINSENYQEFIMNFINQLSLT